MKDSNEAPHKRRGNRRSTLLAIAGAVVITVAVTGLLHVRIALSEAPAAKSPLTVATTVFRPGTDYLRQVSFLGLVASGKKTRLGFEVPGKIATGPLRQGSPVKHGDLVAALDDSALQARRRATAADLEQARSELELAQIKSKRQHDLSASGAVSKEAFDETRLRAQALQSRVEAVTARLLGIDIELEKSRLIAPYDGVIADRYVHPGGVVSPGTPVVRLLQTGSREAHIGVAADRAGSLNIGEPYPISLRGKSLEATLLSVRADVDPLTRAVTAIFELPADIAALDGEPVNLLLEESVDLAGGWLPISALLEGRRGVWTALRLEKDGDVYRTVREAVEVLDVQGNMAYVRGTISSGQRVVADGLHRITPGNPVLLAEGD